MACRASSRVLKCRQWTASFFRLAKNLSLQALSPGLPTREKLCLIWFSLRYSITFLDVYWLPRSLWKMVPAGRRQRFKAFLIVSSTSSLLICSAMLSAKTIPHQQCKQKKKDDMLQRVTVQGLFFVKAAIVVALSYSTYSGIQVAIGKSSGLGWLSGVLISFIVVAGFSDKH